MIQLLLTEREGRGGGGGGGWDELVAIECLCIV